MTEVLSQDEINQLLTVISSNDEGTKEKPIRKEIRKEIRLYDFKRPDLFTKKQLRNLSNKYNVISLYVEQAIENCSSHLCSVDQITYEELIKSIPTETRILKIVHKQIGHIILEIDPKLERVNTIDFIESMSSVFGGFTSHHDFSKERRFYPNNQESGVLFTFELRIKDDIDDFYESMYNIWIPAEELKRFEYGEYKKGDGVFDTKNIKTTIDVSLGKAEWSINELEMLSEGSIIELDRNVGDSVPIYIDGKLIGKGEVVLVDEKFGVRMVESFIKQKKKIGNHKIR